MINDVIIGALISKQYIDSIYEEVPIGDGDGEGGSTLGKLWKGVKSKIDQAQETNKKIANVPEDKPTPSKPSTPRDKDPYSSQKAKAKGVTDWVKQQFARPDKEEVAKRNAHVSNKFLSVGNKAHDDVSSSVKPDLRTDNPANKDGMSDRTKKIGAGVAAGLGVAGAGYGGYKYGSRQSKRK